MRRIGGNQRTRKRAAPRDVLQMTRTIALVNTCMTVIAQARKPHGDYCPQNDAICTSGSSKQIERDAERRQNDDRAPCNLYAESNCMSSQIGIPRGPPIRQLSEILCVVQTPINVRKGREGREGSVSMCGPHCGLSDASCITNERWKSIRRLWRQKPRS